MDRHGSSQVCGEVEIGRVATDDPGQASFQIRVDESTASRHVQRQRDSSLITFFRAFNKLFMLLVCCTILGAPLLVLLIVAFVVLTMAQLVKHGVHYDKVSQLKFVIRLWIFLSFSFVASAAAVIGSIRAQVLNLNQAMVLGLYISNWFILIATLSSISMVNLLVSLIFHFMPPVPLGYNESGFNVHESVLEIVDCLFFLWCMFKAFAKVPVLKEHEILGLYTRKWLRVTVFVIIGYNIIRLVTHLTAWLIKKVVSENLDPATVKKAQNKILVKKLIPREYLVYYANGLKTSITFILSSLLTLLTWVFYFGPRVSKTPEVDKIMLFGTRTFLSVFVCSVFWLFKTWVVLSWETSAIYARLRSELLESKNQLYFLGLLGRQNHDIFKLTYYGPIEREANGNLSVSGDFMSARVSLEMMNHEFWKRRMKDKVEVDDFGKRLDSLDDEQQVMKLSTQNRKKAKYDLMMHNRTPNTHDIKQVADYLISAKTALSDKSFVTSILDKLKSDSIIRARLKKLIDDNDNPEDVYTIPTTLPEVQNNNGSVTQSAGASAIVGNQNESVTRSSNIAPGNPATVDPVIEDDWLNFKKMALINDQFSENLVRTWMENAQNSCLFLANALISTKEVVDVLNTIVSCFLIGATFILWLLLTRLATTEVLVLIVSPLLAATFIFGDTCKTLFQGIMYVYVVHPIYVGDLCSVGEDKLVVQSVGVWTTTFCKVDKLGTSEEVTYPNSELANKVVTNRLSEFVWEDRLEVTLGSLQKPFVKELKKEIKAYLKKEDDLMSCTHTVKAVQEEEGEEDLKIVIILKYKISKIKDWSYLKCVRRRENIKVAAEKLVKEFKEKQNKRVPLQIE